MPWNVAINWFQMENIVEMLWGFAVALICSLGIVLTTKWHGRFTLDGTNGVQKFHVVPTPRIGGVAIFVGLIIACAVSPDSLAELLGPMLIAGLPAFCFGVAEDLTKRVSVRTRLVATMASGTLAWALTGASVSHTGIVGVDFALSWIPFSVLFTAFAVGGVANSVNIIDGFNGLAGGTVAICLVALGLIAHNSGDLELAKVCFLVCAVTVGFLVVNFPLGKLFLGDGGAYLLGFILAWLAVTLAYRNPGVSAWAPLLACAYPIFETLFSIARRVWAKTHPGEPDSHHLHSLINVAVSARLFPNLRADLRNASVSPFSWAIAAVPAALSVQFAGRNSSLALCGMFSFLIYLACYYLVASSSRVRDQKAANEEKVDVGQLARTNNIIPMISKAPVPSRAGHPGAPPQVAPASISAGVRRVAADRMIARGERYQEVE
jgi:UDP-N-acetylmuramyl pentapeptide phosphotransferase/UDP-N-acetylglucosamine-1-phosphate transferase